MNPQFPLYIVSKGRADSRLTSRTLEGMNTPYFIVVEPSEVETYAAVIDRAKILPLDMSYKERYEVCDEFGLTKSTGPGPARNFVWDHSISIGAKWHWVMDDNIRYFYRLNKNRRVPVSDGTCFRVMEDFCLRYKNVAMAGPNYSMFAPNRTKLPPFITNTRIYSCVAPETPILCADLVWRAAGSLVPGQRIVAFDSDASGSGHGNNKREFRTATIERNVPARKTSFVVATDVGIPVQASDDHPWLVLRRVEPLSALRRPRKMREVHAVDARFQLTWVRTIDLKIGDRIAHLTKPWTRDETHEGGWVAGMYDGEGCCTVRRDTYGIQLAIAQKPGPVMERLKSALDARGHVYGITHHKSGCDSIRLGGGFIGALRFAGEFAPTRLIAKSPELWEHRGVRLGQSYEWATVIAIDSVDVQPVAEITTSTGTFITGGYFTHNCNLIRNDTPFRWRGRYNEDTDISLRMLKDGWCTVQFYAFLQGKIVTQALKGGNTAEFYAQEGTMAKSRMQVALHPDVSKLVFKFGRWHHHVDYRPFRNNRMIKRDDIEISDTPNEYGMSLHEGIDPTADHLKAQFTKD